MAKHGVLFERDSFIEKCVNRGALFTEDLDGGAYVVLDKPNAKDPECYDVKKFTNEKEVWVVYNPSVKYDNINGKLFPAQSSDDRDYTNPAGKPFDIFLPKTSVVFGVLQHNFQSGEAMSLAVGDYLEPQSGSTVWKKKTSTPTGDRPAFVVEEIGKVKYPTGTVLAEDEEKVFYVRTVANGLALQ